MIIRNMVIGDYDAARRVWLSCKGMGLNDVDDSREGIRRYLDRNPETCFVAAEGDEIVGVIMAGHDGRRGYIYHTAVIPGRRNRGIGARLVESALEALKACGISKVALVVFSKNAAGNAFWERMGFSERGDLTYRNKALAEMVRLDT